MYKIVEVSSDTNIGGAGKCLLTLLSGYDRSRFDIKVVLPENSLLKPGIEELGVETIEVGGIADKSLDFKSVGTLKALFKKLKPDLVHTHASMSARIAARMAGSKVVYTRHSVFPPPKRISRGIGRLINGAVNNYFSDAIIAVAEAAKENLTDTGVDGRKVTVILNGVNGLEKAGADEKKEIRKRFGINEGERVVSIVARLEDIKGHDYFIEAADAVSKKYGGVRFIIAGTGSYEENLKQKVKNMCLEDTVMFTGFITDVDKLLNITDIQVNASYGTEATSLALLEGMSIGVPAVVSDFGGNPGVITDGENGTIVPRRDSAALADAVSRLLEDKGLYEKMSKRAEEIFTKTFTAEAMTRNTEKLYEKVIGGGN